MGIRHIRTELFMDMHLQRLFYVLISKGMIAFGGRILLAISTIIFNGIIARILDSTDLGKFYIYWTIVLILSILFQLGINRTIVRVIADALGRNNYLRIKSLLSNSAVFILCEVLIVIGVAMVLTSDYVADLTLADNDDLRIMAFVCIWSLASCVQGIVAETYRGFSNIKLATLYDRLFASILVTSIVLLVYLSGPTLTLMSLIILITIINVLIAIIGACVIYSIYLSLSNDGTQITYRELVSISAPLMIGGVVGALFGQVPLWIIGLIHSASDVAIYGTVSRVVNLVTLPLIVINSVVPPIISRLMGLNHKHLLETYLRRIATISGLLSIVVFIIILNIGDKILEVIFGVFYGTGYPSLVILSIGIVVNVVSGSCGQVLMMTHGQQQYMLVNLIALVTMISGLFFITPHYGVLGASVIVTFATIIQYSLFTYLVQKNIGISTHMYLYWR